METRCYIVPDFDTVLVNVHNDIMYFILHGCFNRFIARQKR